MVERTAVDTPDSKFDGRRIEELEVEVLSGADERVRKPAWRNVSDLLQTQKSSRQIGLTTYVTFGSSVPLNKQTDFA